MVLMYPYLIIPPANKSYLSMHIQSVHRKHKYNDCMLNHCKTESYKREKSLKNHRTTLFDAKKKKNIE